MKDFVGIIQLIVELQLYIFKLKMQDRKNKFMESQRKASIDCVLKKKRKAFILADKWQVIFKTRKI